MRRVLRWVKRFALASLALVVLAVGLALVLVHTDWGRERIRRIAEAELASSFPGGARIGRLEGSVLGELVLRDVDLRAADGTPFAKVGALRVDLALLPLLGKTAEIDHLVAEDVELYPLKTIAPPDPGPSDPATWSVELPSIEVRRARVVIEAEAQPVTLDDLSFLAQVSIPAGAPIAASVQRLRGTWRERGAALEGDLAASLGDVVTLPRLELSVGGVRVSGKDVVADPARPLGTLHVEAPAAALSRLVPEVALPADASLDVTATPAAGGEVEVVLTGSVGASRLTGTLHADPAAPRVRGVVTAKDVALEEITRGARTGGGTAIVALVAERARIRGTAIATGHVDGLPAGDAIGVAGPGRGGWVIVGFDAALDRGDRLAAASGLVLAAAGGDTTARGFAALSRRGDALAIDAGRLAAATRDASALARDAGAPVRGTLELAAEVSGTVEPLAVTAAGTLGGDRVAYGEAPAEALTARRLFARFRGAARGSLAKATGEATGWVRGVADAGEPLGDADLGATYRADRTIAAWVRARPAAAEITLSANAVITPGEVTVAALGEHAITMPGGESWRGRGGRVVVRPERVTLERFRTTNRDGRVDVGATYDPATEHLTVALDASAVAAASIHPDYRGLASGKVRLERRGTRWDGTIALAGRGLVLAPDASPLDADLDAKIAGRRVTLQTTARTAALGGVGFDLDVDGPPDLTDPDGWRLLPRAAVRSARLDIDRVNLAAAAIPTGGVVDGTLTIAGAATTGTMTVRGVQTPIGDAWGDVVFRPEDRSELGATATAHVSGIGDADVAARIAFPRHPFDPEAWQRLGRGALAHLGASFSDIELEPALLARFGVDAPYRGSADVDVAIVDGATSAKLEVKVTGVTGGPIVRPIDLHASAMVDPKDGTQVRGHVEDTAAERTMLASFDGKIGSFNLDRWIAAPEQARHARITGGVVTVPGLRGLDGESPAFPLRASLLLAVLGRADLAGGTILGKVKLGGTLGTPTGSAELLLSQLELAHRVPGKPAPGPTDLTIRAHWGGASGGVRIDGRNAGGGTVIVDVKGAPTELAKVSGIFTATDFDLAPLAAFLPEELAAAEGKLRASLVVRGLDSVGKFRGWIRVSQASVPLDPMVGTLREGTATATIDDRGLSLEARGLLGGGQVSLTARSAGHELAAVEATGELDDVSPLGEWEPVIDADVSASFRRVPAADQWRGTIKVANASAVLPPSGSDLGDPDKPRDLLFVEDGPIVVPKFALGGRPPERPWLVADLELAPMKVKAEDLFDTRGEISGKLELRVGDTVGLVGGIEIENGIVGDLFGRRYTATGGVRFDNSLEPTVDITLQHKFPALVLTVLLQGDPDTLVPDFRSDPATYSRDQLAGFFIGGEPGGDPSAQTREAATGAGAALLSSNLGARIRKRLPIRIEQLGCDPGNSVTAASCTVGRWFGERLFVAFKRRIEVQENRNVNANEVQGQYYLRRDLYLEMVGGDAGSGGLDLLWRRRW